MRRLLALAALFMTSAPAAVLAQDLPAGPGADVVASKCSTCHGLDEVTAEHLNPEGWRALVNQMVNFGATLSPEETDQIVNYLAAALPESGTAPSAPVAGGTTPMPPAASGEAAPVAPAGETMPPASGEAMPPAGQ